MKMAKLLQITDNIQRTQLLLRDFIASLWHKGLSFFPCKAFVAFCSRKLQGIPKGAWMLRGHH